MYTHTHTGVGNVILQVASTVGCKCYGIEKADIPAAYAKVGNQYSNMYGRKGKGAERGSDSGVKELYIAMDKKREGKTGRMLEREGVREAKSGQVNVRQRKE